MKKAYLIDIRCDRKIIEKMEKELYSFSIDKNDLNEMVWITGVVSYLLFEAQCVTTGDITLKVYSEDDVLFDSIEALEKYMRSRQIEHCLSSNLCVVTYVNKIKYYGSIEDEMLVEPS